MPSDHEDPDPSATRAVLAYVDLHPSAADDVTGVTTVWLPAMGVHVPMERVEAVLRSLVRQRRLRAHQSLSGNTVYSRL